MRKSTIFLFLLLGFCVSFFSHKLHAQTSSFDELIFQIKKVTCPKLTGRVVPKGDPSYQTARLVSNFYTSKNKFPQLIVYCYTTQDVQNAVIWARCHQVPIRIRSGGHNHEGFSTGTGTIVIDVSNMKHIKIDREHRKATVGPGINNKELYAKLYKEGLTHVGGTCSDVGLSGLVLSGGMGLLYRKYGLTCDTLLEIEMIDANGRLIHATRNNKHKDLFWALRGGGGGNFGVVTSITLSVPRALPVTWFNIGWDWNQPVKEIINAWQNFFAKDDRRWFSHLDVWSAAFPTEKLKKQPIKIMGVFWGTPEHARRELAPLLKIGTPNNQTIEFVTWNKAIEFIEDSTAVYKFTKPEYKSPGAYAMQKLPKAAIEIIYDTLKNTSSPYMNILLFSLGGAAQDIPPTDTAYFYRKAKYFITYSIEWLSKNEDQKRIGEINTFRKRLLPYTEGDYIGNPDSQLKDYLKTYYGDNVDRLRCVKRKYDPQNVFRFEQSIPPAPSIWRCTIQ